MQFRSDRATCEQCTSNENYEHKKKKRRPNFKSWIHINFATSKSNRLQIVKNGAKHSKIKYEMHYILCVWACLREWDSGKVKQRKRERKTMIKWTIIVRNVINRIYWNSNKNAQNEFLLLENRVASKCFNCSVFCCCAEAQKREERERKWRISRRKQIYVKTNVKWCLCECDGNWSGCDDGGWVSRFWLSSICKNRKSICQWIWPRRRIPPFFIRKYCEWCTKYHTYFQWLMDDGLTTERDGKRAIRFTCSIKGWTKCS